MRRNDETTNYAQMGMAALLPGMQHMVELMQAQLDSMREQLGVMQMPQKMGRPRKDGKLASGWSADPAERSREMMRRRMVARDTKRRERARKRENGQKPTMSAEQKEKLRASALKNWNALSPRQQKLKMKKMVAARNANRAAKARAAAKAKVDGLLETPTVKMAVAS